MNTCVVHVATNFSMEQTSTHLEHSLGNTYGVVHNQPARGTLTSSVYVFRFLG